MIETVLVPDETYLESLKRYVGFTDESSAVLRAARPLVAPHFGPLIDDFYATIEAHPGAQKAITGGSAQIARLKQTLLRWLDELFLGPHDEDYFERRARIGRVHVRISLPQAYMLTAMDRMRNQAAAAIREVLVADRRALESTLTAMHQIMDIDLAIMLETYREDLEAKNRATERLATIGQFAAGIGHELRNPLSVIESSVFLLRQRLQAPTAGDMDPKVTRHLDKIATEVKRATSTINDLLELARNKPPRRRPTALRELVDGAIAVASLPSIIDVKVSIADEGGGDGVAIGDLDPDQIARVLTNLLINAAQAMEAQAERRIWIDASRAGAETRIRVRDNGPGVAPEARSRIFEALFTTKAKGTGLGLALCKRIAEAHGGTVVLEPAGEGASFLITIPDHVAEGPR